MLGPQTAVRWRAGAACARLGGAANGGYDGNNFNGAPGARALLLGRR